MEDVAYEEDSSQELEGELPIIKASLFLESIGAGSTDVVIEKGLSSPGSVEAKGAGGDEFVTPVSTMKIDLKSASIQAEEGTGSTRRTAKSGFQSVKRGKPFKASISDKQEGALTSAKKKLRKGQTTAASGMFEAISPPKLNSPKFSQLDLYLKKVKNGRTSAGQKKPLG